MRAPPVKPKPVPPPLEIAQEPKAPPSGPSASYRTHAQGRLEERFRLEVTPADLVEIANLIRDGSPAVKLVRQMMVLRGDYEVVWRAKKFRVIYQPHEHKIITALPVASKDQRKGNMIPRKGTRGNPRSASIEFEADEVDEESGMT